jgi:uncharacterized membrane protein YkvA (DUF1232 family)
VGWWQELVLAVCGGLLVTWLALLGVLAVVSRGRDRAVLGEGLRLLPDVIRLLRRLAADRSVPRGVRVRLGLMLGYLLMPIDLVPDFLPVIGYADDAVVVALAVRSLVRAAGVEVLAAHWPGTPTGLAVLHRLAGLPAPATTDGPTVHGATDDAATG